MGTTTDYYGIDESTIPCCLLLVVVVVVVLVVVVVVVVVDQCDAGLVINNGTRDVTVLATFSVEVLIQHFHNRW